MGLQKDWDKKAGKRMWEDGHGDADIAKAMGVTQGTISYFRRKHWEPERDAALAEEQFPVDDNQDSVEVADAPIYECQEAETAPVQEEIPCNDPVCAPDLNAEAEAKTPIQKEATPYAHIPGPSKEGPGSAKTEDTDSDHRMLFRALEEATRDLTGMDAVMTAQVIAQLWRWTDKSERMEAKACLDYLIRRCDHVV